MTPFQLDEQQQLRGESGEEGKDEVREVCTPGSIQRFMLFN